MSDSHDVREQLVREWLGDSAWRWTLYRTVYYGVRVLGSLALLAVAYLLDELVPRSVEWTATVVLLWWVHHFARVSEGVVAEAREREREARRWRAALLIAAGVLAIGYAAARSAIERRQHALDAK